MAVKAKESKKIEKIRKKLEKVLNEEHRNFNSETLREVRNSIKKWINRHESERISLENKTFKLFDENEHPSETKSYFVKHLLSDIEQESEVEEEERSKLLGRVTHRQYD